MDAYTTQLLYGGLALSALAWVWLIVRAFQVKAWWGLISLLFPPGAFLFAWRHAQHAISPMVLFVLGGLVTAVPMAYSLAGPRDLGLREKLREGPTRWSVTVDALQSDAAHQWMERRAFYMLLGGLLVAALAWSWLLVRAFRQHRRWGVGSLALPPVRLMFAGRYRKQGISPLVLFLIGLLIATSPALFTLFIPLDLGPFETMVDDHRHLTLTGWDRKDYSVLRFKPNVVVLQVANPDVTDESLESLHEVKGLEELDLSGTQVSHDTVAAWRKAKAERRAIQ